MGEEDNSGDEPQPLSASVRAFLSHPIVAFVAALVFTTLSTSGVVNMATSVALLVGAWALGTFGIHSAEGRQHKLWITMAGSAGLFVFLMLVGLFEIANTPKREIVNIKELASQVAEDLKDMIPNRAPSVAVATPPARPIIVRLPGHNYRVDIRLPNPATSSSPPLSNEADSSWANTMAAYSREAEKNQARVQAESSCLKAVIAATSALYGLSVRGANSLNAWAISKDDAKEISEYKSWLSDANDVLAANKVSAADVAAFEQAADPNPAPTFLFIHNAGYHTWQTFNAKRKVIEAIEKKINETDCSIDSAQSVIDRLNKGTF